MEKEAKQKRSGEATAETKKWETEATYIMLVLSEKFPSLLTNNPLVNPDEVVAFLRFQLKQAAALRGFFPKRGGPKKG